MTLSDLERRDARGQIFLADLHNYGHTVSLRMSEFWYDMRRNKFLRVSHVPHPKHAFSVTGL